MRRPTNIYIARGPDGLDDVLAKLRSGPLAVDTETTGLDWHVDRVGSIQVAAGTTALFVCGGALAPFTRWLSRQIRDQRELVFHHAKFDLHMLRSTFGLHVPYPVHDTMLESFLLDNRGVGTANLPNHHLKGLARVFVDPLASEPEKEMMQAIRQAGGKHKGDWMLLMGTEHEHYVTRYSALDPWYTLQLHLQFIERIRYWPQPEGDYPPLAKLYETERWLTLALRDMEARGIKARRRFLEEWQRKLEQDIADDETATTRRIDLEDRHSAGRLLGKKRAPRSGEGEPEDNRTNAEDVTKMRSHGAQSTTSGVPRVPGGPRTNSR